MSDLYAVIFLAAKAVIGVSITLSVVGLAAGLADRYRRPGPDGQVERRTGLPDRRGAAAR